MSISQHVQPTKDSVRASRVYGVGFKDTSLNIHSFKQNFLTIVVHVKVEEVLGRFEAFLYLLISVCEQSYTFPLCQRESSHVRG